MTIALAVSVSMVRSWRNGMIAALGGNVWAMRFIVSMIVLAAALWQWAMFSVAGSMNTDTMDMSDPAVASALVKVTFLLSFQLSMAISGILLIVTSGSMTGFNAVLALAPVSRFVRGAVVDAPIITIGFLAGISASLPYTWQLVSAWGIGHSLPLLVGWPVIAAAGALLVLSLARVITWAVVWITRVEESIAQPLIIAATIVVAAWQGFKSALGNSGGLVQRISEESARLTAEGDPLALVIPGAAITVLVLLWLVGAALRDRRGPTTWMKWTGPRAKAVRRRARMRWVLEFFQQVRHPSMISLVVLNAVVLVIALVHPTVRENALALIVPLLLIEPPLVLAMSGYGATWRAHWLYRAHSHRPVSWVKWKWLATFALTVVNALVVVSVAWLVTGSLPISPSELVQVLIWFLSGMLAGVMVPVESEQSLSSISTFVVGIGLGVGGTLALDRLGSPLAAIAATGVAVVAVYLAYSAFVRWRERDLVHMH